jgi:dephospho-CoA kinase
MARPAPRLIGLTGTNAAGKGEVARFLGARGYAYRSLSDVLRAELARRGLEATRDNLIRVGNELRAVHGADVLARRAAADLGAGQTGGPGRVVVDSIRNAAEVAYLRGLGNFLLIGVDAPVEIRFERARLRGRNESAATLEEFRAKEAVELRGDETGQQLEACLRLADILIINDGTLEALGRKLEEALE